MTFKTNNSNQRTHFSLKLSIKAGEKDIDEKLLIKHAFIITTRNETEITYPA